MKASFGIRKFKDISKKAYKTRSKIWQMVNDEKLNDKNKRLRDKNTRHSRKYRQKLAAGVNKINCKSLLVSKKIRRNGKNITNNILNRLLIKPTSIVDLLLKLGVHKHTLSLKLVFILAIFVALLVMDNFVISFIMTTADVFCIALIFSFTTASKLEATIDGKFDYGIYKKIKARKDIIAIVIAFFTTTISIMIGHCYVADIVRL